MISFSTHIYYIFLPMLSILTKNWCISKSSIENGRYRKGNVTFSCHLKLLCINMEDSDSTIGRKVQTTTRPFPIMLPGCYKVKILLENHKYNQNFKEILWLLMVIFPLEIWSMPLQYRNLDLHWTLCLWHFWW